MVSVELCIVRVMLLTFAFMWTATSCIKYCSFKNYVYAGTEYSSGETHCCKSAYVKMQSADTIQNDSATMHYPMQPHCNPIPAAECHALVIPPKFVAVLIC
jgi:hypothetical protein